MNVQMPLPAALLSIADSARLFRKIGLWLDDEAERISGSSYNLDKWRGCLSVFSFDLIVLVHFLGTWEGSGSFVNEACDWWDEQTRVKRALITFGCEKTAAIFDDAAELSMQIANRYDSDQKITPEQATQREEMNRIANEDVSYEKLASFIRKHQHEFLQCQQSWGQL